MNHQYAVTYKYTKRRTAVQFVVATMTLEVARHISAAEIVGLVEHAHTDIRVIGIERQRAERWS